MYYFTATNRIKFINKSQFAKELGVSASYINQVLNQKIHCSKLLAYCITKKLDSNAEINDFFTLKESK